MEFFARRSQSRPQEETDSFGEGLLEETPSPDASEVDEFQNPTEHEWVHLLDEEEKSNSNDDLALSVLELLEAHAGMQESTPEEKPGLDEPADRPETSAAPSPKEYSLGAEMAALDELDLEDFESEPATEFVGTEESVKSDSMPEASPPGETVGDGTILELQQRLQEKETLIEFLTDRLEQTVDQLDRLQRTGGNRTRAPSGGMPNDLVEDQRELLQELQGALDQWAEMQVGLSLGKLTMQVSELRELIVDQVIPARQDLPITKPTPSPKKQAPAAEKEKGSSVWEAMKAQMLNGDRPSASPHSPTSPQPEDHEETGLTSLEEPLIDLGDLKAPDPIDLDHATPQQIVKALDERDEFIVKLTKQLRSVGSQRYRAPNWEQVGECPEQLKSSLQKLEERIRETLRVAEVELSMERARLGREEIRIRQLKEEVDVKLKRLGLNAEGESERKNGKTNGQDSGNGRWRRFLGINPNHDAE